MFETHRWLMRLAIGTLVAVLLASMGFAQSSRGGYRRSRRMPPKFRPADHRDNGFTFCRLMFTSVRRESAGRGWRTDYPAADVNFMIRLSELTSTKVDFADGGSPNHWVVEITDPELFTCPFVMTSDVGTMGLSGEEVERLRDYLVKGGFLWVDDFWGPFAWEQWAGAIGKVLPPGRYPIVDIPMLDPLHHGMFDVEAVPQVPSIQHFRRVGGTTTSERGTQSAEVHVRGIYDEHGRLMVLMTHNTDIADGWEREGEDYEFFYRFSVTSYAVGINVILHAMTH